MGRIRAVAGVIALLLLMSPAAPVLAAGASKDKGKGKADTGGAKVMKVKRDGHAYCFERAIVYGGAVVTGGRCYTFYMLRTTGGIFLAFGPPGPPMVPPGQIVRMGTPAGAKMKGRLFYLVPVNAPVTIIPVDTIRYIPVVVAPRPGQVVITVPRAAAGPAQDRPIELAFLER